MNNRRTITTVAYQLKPDSGSLTLHELAEFAGTLESIGEARLLTGSLSGNLREGVYVTGVVRVPDQKGAQSCDAELLAENEALHARLDRIRALYDGWHANRIGQATLREEVEQELQGHAPAAAGISESQTNMVALYLEQWREGALGAVTALQNISGLLGLNPLPPDDEGDD